MLKDYGVIKQLASELAWCAQEAATVAISESDEELLREIESAISNAADRTATDVISDFETLQGREEEITAQLRGEINRRLLDNVKQALNGRDFPSDRSHEICIVEVATFKRRQETDVGADLAGVVTYNSRGARISKAFLAQAKVGVASHGKNGTVSVKSRNADTLKQAKDMLKITSDAFFFVYSKYGIHCVPALQVVLSGTNVIDTSRHPFHSFGAFYQEFFKCFIGDHLISPVALKTSSLEDYAEKLTASAVLKLNISLV